MIANTLVKLAGASKYLNVIRADFTYVIHMAMRLSTILCFKHLLGTGNPPRARKASCPEPRIPGLVTTVLKMVSSYFGVAICRTQKRWYTQLILIAGRAGISLSQLGEPSVLYLRPGGSSSLAPYPLRAPPLDVG